MSIHPHFMDKDFEKLITYVTYTENHAEAGNLLIHSIHYFQDLASLQILKVAKMTMIQELTLH